MPTVCATRVAANVENVLIVNSSLAITQTTSVATKYLAIMFKPILVCFALCLGGALSGCIAAPRAATMLPQVVWSQLEANQAQDLIVELASVALKPAALAALPAGDAELLKDFDGLPMMFVRFRSEAALKALLANPGVVNVYQDQQENRMPAK